METNIKNIEAESVTFHCDVCSKKFFRKDNYLVHLQRHNSGFDCFRCHKPHDSQLDLDCHSSLLHRTEPEGVSATEGGQSSSNFHKGLFIPSWTIVKHYTSYIRKYKSEKTFYTVSVKNKEHFEPSPHNLEVLFTDLVTKLTDGVDKSHSVALTLKSPSLDYSIVLPYTRLGEFKARDILGAIESQLNSQEDFCIDGRLKVALVHVEIPEGRGLGDERKPNSKPATFKTRSGPVSVFRNLEEAYLIKKCVVQIR